MPCDCAGQRKLAARRASPQNFDGERDDLPMFDTALSGAQTDLLSAAAALCCRANLLGARGGAVLRESAHQVKDIVANIERHRREARQEVRRS